MWLYVLGGVRFVLFVLSQLYYFWLNKVICEGANAKIDGSFVATMWTLGKGGCGRAAPCMAAYHRRSWDDEYPVPHKRRHKTAPEEMTTEATPKWK
ncbi:hypothetical protein FIBSPDRAFT_1051828 [Athelia psychrophila]|uniref:Uncharacterized protein n=1 Tax=Athelia psychrophila TaxID=1759441 RepID=A0A165YBZ9_9AGAM|nr:hypothetical protein FIBSPDRAFT_1051828 [Fibularhizoctonia sp. CBS 109695]